MHTPGGRSTPIESRTSGNPTRRPLALLDSLFFANAFDSILTIIPDFMTEAETKRDSALYGGLLTARGRVELMQGRYDDAYVTLTSSIELAESINDTVNWMNALGFKGFAVTGMGRAKEGETLQRKRLALALASHHRRSEAWSRTAIAYLLLQRGETRLAQIEYTLGVNLFRAENLRREELTPLIGLGRVFHALGQIDEARATYQRVWLVAREIDDSVQAAMALNNLGVLESAQGNMGAAVQYYEHAYKLQQRVGYVRGAITPLGNVALARAYLGQYTEAAEILEDIVSTCETVNLQEMLSESLAILGDVRLLQERPAVAAMIFRQVLSLDEAVSVYARFRATYGLARSLAARDSTAAAREYLASCLDDARAVEEVRWKISVRLLLARLLRQDGDPVGALAQCRATEQDLRSVYGERIDPEIFLETSLCHGQTEAPDSALTYLYRGVAAMEEFRRLEAGYEWREAFTQQGGDYPLVEAAIVLLEYPSERPYGARISELFDLMQRGKARTLIERITEPREQSETIGDLSSRSPVTLAELRNDILTPEELFLDFVVGRDVTLLFAVTLDSLRVLSLPGRRSVLPSKVDLYCATFGSGPPAKMPKVPMSSYGQMQLALGSALLAGVADLIADAGRIIIAPDAFLNAVPFGTLVVEADGDMLLDTNEIQQVPSATVLRLLRSHAKGGEPANFEKKLLALASTNRETGAAPMTGTLAEVHHLSDNYEDVDVEMTDTKEGASAWGNLSRYEVLHIAAHIEVSDEKPWRSGIFFGSEEVAKRARSKRTTTRTVARRESPAVEILSSRDSTIVAREIKGDSFVRAGEIADLVIATRLVVLSGCESAGGRATFGEGVLGLTSAFLSAGVPAIVATLWPVDDVATVELMKIFYAGLADGKTVSAALRTAQLDVRERRETQHPFYWAGFVVVGDGNTTIALATKPAGSRGNLTMFAGLLLLVVLIIIGRNRMVSRRRL